MSEAGGALPDLRMRGALAAWDVRPVIAHRGASGYLPEHTLASYALAFGQGADFLEPDLVLTRDQIPICLHDIHLERVTDVAQAFPGRAREDGRFYALDFTLDEVRTLTATGGERHRMRGMGVPTFEEFLSLARHLAERAGRPIGIAPELKAPAWHRAEGAPMEEICIRALQGSGFLGDAKARCIVQCFESETLTALRSLHGVKVTLLELLGDDAPTEEALDAIAERADAIGPPKAMIEATGGQLVKAAHARGLGVIPYTFKDDKAETRRFFETFGVDGLFSDFPDVALAARSHR